MKSRILSLSIICIFILISCDKNDEVILHPRIFIPTVFSPDNNGTNEVFRPVGAGLSDVKEFKMIITDENGYELYTTDNYLKGWNGKKSNGDPYPNGFYFYDIWFSYTDKTAERVMGTVEITTGGW